MKSFFIYAWVGIFFFFYSSGSATQEGKQTPNSQCLDQGATKWLGFLPNTPLVLVKSNPSKNQIIITPAGQSCCLPFAKKGEIYFTIDKFGHLVGEARIENSESYEVTGCHELVMKQVKGTKGAGIYVSKDLPFPPKPSSVWEPSQKQILSLQKKIQTRNSQIRAKFDVSSCQNQGEERPSSPSAPIQILYFLGKNQQRYAAVPGLGIAIFHWQKNQNWNLVYQQIPSRIHPPCIPFSTPLAVLDMNQDDLPEVIFHTQGGPFCQDQVFSEQPKESFQLIAQGVMGSSL